MNLSMGWPFCRPFPSHIIMYPFGGTGSFRTCYMHCQVFWGGVGMDNGVLAWLFMLGHDSKSTQD